MVDIQCVEAQAGVTLSQLQRYLHGHGLEMAFSAEIGSATLGGVCFATTKDRALGPVCPSGGIGDFQSCLMALTVVIRKISCGEATDILLQHFERMYSC